MNVPEIDFVYDSIGGYYLLFMKAEGRSGKGSGKIDYDLAKDYIRDIESKTGLKLGTS